LITCEECRRRLLPDDPRVKSGRYRLSCCDYCDKPDYYRELEKPPVVEHIVRHSDMGAKEFDQLQQTAAEVKYLRDKVAELEEQKRKADYY